MTPTCRVRLDPLPTPATVAVVIPARNAGATLEGSVSSALAQQVEGSLEIVVAVGPSEDDTAGVAEQLAADSTQITVVDNPGGTAPSGLNQAIAATSADVIVRLDAHAALPVDYTQRAVDILRDTGAANVGGRQEPVATSGFGRCVAAAMVSPFGAGGARYRTGGEAGEADTVYLGVFRRDALLAVGGFDERLVRNQDYELNYRLRAAGGKVIFHPDLAVAYVPRDSVRRLARQYYDYGRWKRAVLALHPASLRARQLAPPLLVLSLIGGTVLGWLLGRSRGRAWLPALPVTMYATALFGAGVQAAPDRRAGLGTALALATMHLAWGIGFLRGGIRLPIEPATPLRTDEDPGQ